MYPNQPQSPQAQYPLQQQQAQYPPQSPQAQYPPLSPQAQYPPQSPQAQYPSQQQQYPAQSASGLPVGMAGQPLADPVKSGSALKIRNLSGRAIIAIPKSYDPTAPGFDAGTTAPAVTLDVIVLDGGLLWWGDVIGGDMAARHGNTLRSEVPCRIDNMIDSHVNIVGALKGLVGKQAVMGRIETGQGTKGNPPWILTPLAPDDQVRPIAERVWGELSMGTFVNPPTTETGMPRADDPWGSTPSPNIAGGVAHAWPQVAECAATVPSDPGALPCPPNWSPSLWETFTEDQKATVYRAQQGGSGGTPF